MKRIAFVLMLVGMVFGSAFADRPLRIMPIGDSITYGQGWDPYGGYRAVLRELLVAAGYTVDYVGTQTGNQGTLSTSGDIQHEGHGGWTADRVLDAFPGWSAQIDAPNVILLLIGTNSCNSDHTSVMNQIKALLDEIKRLQPSAHVICGTLPPFLNGTEVGSNIVWIEDHNALLRTEITSRAYEGDRISLADIYPVISPTEGMNDDRHPNETGYRAMAHVWFDAITAVFPNPAVEPEEPDLTVVQCVMDEKTGDHLSLSFNGTVGAGALDATHYSFSAGFEPASFAFSNGGRSVVITGTRPAPAGVTCTVNISGVPSSSGAKTVVPASLNFRFLPYGARYYVPEIGLYRKVYGFTFPASAGYLNNAPVYDFDEHASVGAYTRIAYWIELQKDGEELQYMWISMDSFTNDTSRIAIPTLQALTGDREIIQKFVTNMKVISNVEGVTSGDKERGNIEFWPYNYYQATKLGIAGASGSTYDVDDSCNLSGTFGCMQIHDTDALMPLFCFNNWGGTGNSHYDLGLGANSNASKPDWTQSSTSQGWNKRRIMEIYVMEDIADETVPTAIAATLAESRNAITVTFDAPILDEPNLLSKVALSDGTEIRSVKRGADGHSLVIACPYLRTVTGLTVTIEGVHAATPLHTEVPRTILPVPGADIAWTYPTAPASVIERVPDAANYAHLYTIDIQPNMRISVADEGYGYVNRIDQNAYDAAHVVNNTNSAPVLYSRVGYLLELVYANDVTNWVWTSFDAFSSDYGDIDIPTANPDHPQGGYVNGRFVANLDIDSNVDGIVKGKGLATGVIEFSPWDYAGGNPRNVPNASTAFDFGDQLHVRAGNFACMQVANFAADLGNSSTGQIVWALGRFNGRGVCVGIGNCPNTTDIDYTWANNAGNYKSRTLYVLVKPDDEADENDDYVPMHAVASSDGRQVAVSFASAVRATAAQPRYFSIGGVGVTDAEVSSIDARDIILTLASPLAPDSAYTVATLFPRSTNKTLAFNTIRALPTALTSGVEEIGDYTLLYDLTIPYYSRIANDGADYRTDESRFGITRKIERIAYALEFQYTETEGGAYNWAWVSMDPFTYDPALMGVPSVTRGNHFQCYVDNISVRAGSSSGSAPIATGEWPQGNIEFTPSNYGQGNARNIPGATSAFDFGDDLYGNGNSAGHGCMQIHNYLMEDMILGVSRTGGGQVPGLMIGLKRNADGTVADDGTWTANRHLMTTYELRVFMKLTPEPDLSVTNRGAGVAFLVQPQSQRVKFTRGDPPQKVILNAYAPAAMRYQWRKNGSDIVGATGPVLEILVDDIIEDSYTVVAFADESNYTTSDPAIVRVIPNPFIISIK